MKRSWDNEENKDNDFLIKLKDTWKNDIILSQSIKFLFRNAFFDQIFSFINIDTHTCYEKYKTKER